MRVSVTIARESALEAIYKRGGRLGGGANSGGEGGKEGREGAEQT